MKSMQATPPVRWILAWNSCEERLSPDFSASLLKDLPGRTLACLEMEADNIHQPRPKPGLGRIRSAVPRSQGL